MAGEFGPDFSPLHMTRCSRQVEAKFSAVLVDTDCPADRICGGRSLRLGSGDIQNYLLLILRNPLLTNESSAYSGHSRYHDYLDGFVCNSTGRSLQ